MEKQEAEEERERQKRAENQLTPARLQELQSECMADDLPIEADMTYWTEAEVRRFFESGGVERVPKKLLPRGSSPAR